MLLLKKLHTQNVYAIHLMGSWTGGQPTQNSEALPGQP